MKGARTLVWATTILSCTVGCAVFAQILPGRISATGISQPTQLSLATKPQGTFGTNSDVMFGTGTAGPYTFGYKPINQFSESISVDGKLQQRDFDYDMNYAAGSITFRRAIGTSSAIRAEYSYDPSKATANRAPMSIPLNVNLVKSQSSGLQFTGLYKQADPNVKAASDLMVYGLTGDKKLGSGQISSMFLFSPDVSSQSGGGGFSDRSAIKLGGTTNGGNFQLTTSYLHVGEQFSGAKDYSLQQGVDTVNVGASYAASKALNLSSSFNKTEALAGATKGEVVSTSQEKMVLTPTGGGSKMTLAHTQVDKNKANTADVKTVTDSMLLEQKLGTNLAATASRESVTSDVGSSQTRLTTNQLILNAKPTDNLAITSRIAQKDSSVTGGELGYGMDINASPTKTMSLKASMNRTNAEQTGQSAAETLNFVANPSKLLNLAMDVAHSNTDAAGDTLVHHLKIVSTPRADWRLELGMNGKNVSTPSDEFARTAMLSATAMKNTALVFNWAQNESDANGTEELQGVKVVSRPWKIMTVSGGVSQRQTLTTRDFNKEAAMELRPFANTTLAGKYKETDLNGAVVATVSEVTASTDPKRHISVSGGYKTRATAGQDDLNSMNVAMQLNTGGAVKLTGSYATNPEDQKGVVQRLNAQSLDIKTDFGDVKLKGAYTQKEEYLVGRRGQQTDVGLDFRLSPNSLLTTSYSLGEMKDTSLLQTYIYALGFTHRVGSSMNLYLTGRMTTYQKDRMMLDDRTDLEAEARLGLQF